MMWDEEASGFILSMSNKKCEWLFLWHWKNDEDSAILGA